MKVSLWWKFAVATCSALAMATSAWAGGTLRYATVGEPPSLDQHVLTSDLATTIAHHMFEGLYTFNSSNAPVGLLAAGEKLADGGKTIVISLRKGVKFLAVYFVFFGSSGLVKTTSRGSNCGPPRSTPANLAL